MAKVERYSDWDWGADDGAGYVPEIKMVRIEMTEQEAARLYVKLGSHVNVTESPYFLLKLFTDLRHAIEGDE